MAHTKPETLVSCTRIYHYNVLCYFPTASIFVSEAAAVIAAKGNELRRRRAGPAAFVGGPAPAAALTI